MTTRDLRLAESTTPAEDEARLAESTTPYANEARLAESTTPADDDLNKIINNSEMPSFRCRGRGSMYSGFSDSFVSGETWLVEEVVFNAAAAAGVPGIAGPPDPVETLLPSWGRCRNPSKAWYGPGGSSSGSSYFSCCACASRCCWFRSLLSWKWRLIPLNMSLL